MSAPLDHALVTDALESWLDNLEDDEHAGGDHADDIDRCRRLLAMSPAVRHVAEALCVVNHVDPWADPDESTSAAHPSLWDWAVGLAPELLAENDGDVRATIAELWVL